MTFIDTGGGSNSNPAIYSPAALSALGIPAISAIYQVTIDVTFNGTPPPISVPVSFGTVGSTGNDPVTGNYYVAQDNSNGLGFVTILNNAISGSSVPGGTNALQFKANPIFSILNGTGYDSSGFNGISLEIKTTQIKLVTITDNSSILSSIAVPPTSIAPFLGNYYNTQGSTETCTGMFPGDPLGNFSTDPVIYNNLVFGGSIY
jgi:hypothetical protein